MASPRPRVSLVMPVYNAAATVARAVESVLTQRYEDLELVAIDDGSSDDTPDILDTMSAADDRLRVIDEPHRGLVAALNRGLDAARGELIGRMDADDWSAPSRLARQVALLDAEPDLDLVSCRVAIERQDGQPLLEGMRRYESWVNALIDPADIARERFVESPLVHPTVLARRPVFDGGYRGGAFPEDYELWLRCLARGLRMAKVPEVLFGWTDRPQRLTRTHDSYSATAFRRLKLDYLLKGPLRERPEVVVWGTGPNGKRWLRELTARGLCVPVAVELDPRKIGQTIHGAAVIAPADLSAQRGDRPILAAVGAPGGREAVRTWLGERGLTEGADWWAVC